MRLRCVDTLDEFDRLREDWAAAYKADSHATVFLSWVWLRGWFEVAPYEWLVLAIQSNSTSSPVAFLPLGIDASRRRLQMGGAPWADYTGFVCIPEYQEKALKAFAGFIQRQLQWDGFCMRDVSDPRLDLFLRHFSEKSFHIQEKKGISCPYIPLPNSWEHYLRNSVSRRTRKNLRRYLRRLESRSDLQVTPVREDNLEHQIETFLALYQMRWGEQSERAFRRFRTIFRRCFESNSLWLTVLWAADTPIAADAGFVDRDKKVFSSYLGGWDDGFADLSPGDTLSAYAIRYAIENGFQVYDFLRGAERYKFSFGAEERFNRDVIIARKSLRLAARKLVRRVRPVFRSKVQESRV